MAVQLMTKAAYARHRGCDEKAVRKAIAENRISCIDGKIDPVVADIQWAQNTRARASNAPVVPDGQLPLENAAPSTRLHTEPVDIPKNDEYMTSRTRRESAEAEMAELKLAEQHGHLIRVDAVKQALANAFTATRDSLLQIPSRLAAVLAAETDAAKVHELLQLELYRALEGMSAVQNSNRLAGREQTA